MAQHGYLGDDYGSGYDPDYDERDRDRERGWRDRGFMFDERERGGDRGRDRGFFSRMAGEARGWFGDEEDDRRPDSERDRWSERHRGTIGYGREHGYGGFQGDYSRSGRGQGGFGGAGDYREGRRSFSSHPDDHYLSWREKQLQALDRDYAEYCREREQRFHQDFDSWRRGRQGGSQPSAAGRSDELLLDRNTPGVTTEAPQEPQTTVDTESGATLGTTPSSTRGKR